MEGEIMNKKAKFIMPHSCVMGISNNWRKMHHYPMRKRYKKYITYPCDKLREAGICELPFC